MKKKKEIVLYVEGTGLVKQKKTDDRGKDGKERAWVYAFLEKNIQPNLAIPTGK